MADADPQIGHSKRANKERHQLYSATSVQAALSKLVLYRNLGGDEAEGEDDLCYTGFPCA